MRSSMRQLQQRILVLLAALACSAQAVMAQFPPLQPFEPLQPLQPFRPLAPLPPMKPLPGFAPFPQMELPQFPSFAPQQPFAGAAAAGGRAGGPRMGPGTYSASSSSSSFGGPRASTTPGCTVVQETAGDSQGSSKAGTSSCSLSQRIEVCQSSKPGSRGHTRAIATINGQSSTCCVVLMKLPAKTPQLFCAAPGRATAYARLPAASTAVELKPQCSSSTAVGTAGSLSCTGGCCSAHVEVVACVAWGCAHARLGGRAGRGCHLVQSAACATRL